MKPTLALLTALLLAPLAALHAAEAAMSPTKPNIVFIFADDWGWGDLSCHGHPWLKTPHLDRLASEGIDFHEFNVLNPVCSPSRGCAGDANVAYELKTPAAKARGNEAVLKNISLMKQWAKEGR